jgi:precorrin-2 C20-methyltransferase/precorrin-3B C17-methyltransferase
MPCETGRLFGVGVGPGDPELLTLKAARIIGAAHVVAYHAARHGRSNARAVAASLLRADHIEVPMIYPVTAERTLPPEGYDAAMRAFYDASAATLAAHLDAGRDVAVLCEGDPFFYGSYMYVHDRLAPRYVTHVVPGVSSIMAAAVQLGTPLVRRDTEMVILPGTLPEHELIARLSGDGAFAIMKLGRHFAKVRAALERSGAIARALYIERATMDAQRVVPVRDVDPDDVPYFSLIIVPGTATLPARDVMLASEAALASDGPRSSVGAACGAVVVVGLGPAGDDWRSPEVARELAGATDLVGYQTYLARVPMRAGQVRHASDNRVEVRRAQHAFALAAAGRRVCVVSAGDPGIFAMAAAVFEALESGPPAWRDLELRIAPGISALTAAAARAGAPLGGDFAAISLSDRLKPWSTVVTRLEAAASADFALALFNPASSQRRHQLDEARAVLLRHRAPETPVVLARDVGGPTERVRIVTLGELRADDADMRTLVIVGASTTRTIARADGSCFVYTPRFVEGAHARAATFPAQVSPLPAGSGRHV